MSGICGIVHFDGEPVDPAQLEKMAQAMAHRGPDGIRYWVQGNMGMAHLALNTTPESVVEVQPLHDLASGCILTANARIDNRDELIPYLIAKDHLQKDQISDADVILAAYLEWGRECPSHLIGDFVFVVWDPSKQEIIAARDPLGQKVLYYHSQPGLFCWSSEAATLPILKGIPKAINNVAIASYLNSEILPYYELSFYKGIQVLQPSECLIASELGINQNKYWEFNPQNKINYIKNEDYVEHFRELFYRAVKDRLRSVSPIGIFLSGGLDSTCLTGAAAQMSVDGKVHIPGLETITWYVPEEGLDERHRSRPLAEKWNLPNVEIDISPYWPLFDYPAWAPMPDSPLESPIYGPFNISLETCRKPRIWLTGVYGDNIIGMPNWNYYLKLFIKGKLLQVYRELDSHRRLYQLPWGFVFREISASIKGLPLFDGPRKALRLIKPRRQVLSVDFERTAQNQITDKCTNDQDRLLSSIGFFRRLAWKDRYRVLKSINVMMFQAWFDNVASRHHCEIWHPWADVRLAQFVLAIDPDILAQGVNHKLLVRKAMKGVVPDTTLEWRGRRTGAPLMVGKSMISASYIEMRNKVMNGWRLANTGWVISEQFSAEMDVPWKWITLERWLQKYW